MKTVFLNFGTTDIWGQMILCWAPQLWHQLMSPDTAACPLGVGVTIGYSGLSVKTDWWLWQLSLRWLAENHWGGDWWGNRFGDSWGVNVAGAPGLLVGRMEVRLHREAWAGLRGWQLGNGRWQRVKNAHQAGSWGCQSTIVRNLYVKEKSKRIPEKHLFLLYWLCQSLWLCGSQ